MTNGSIWEEGLDPGAVYLQFSLSKGIGKTLRPSDFAGIFNADKNNLRFFFLHKGAVPPFLKDSLNGWEPIVRV